MASRRTPRRNATRKNAREKNTSPRASGRNYLPDMSDHLERLVEGVLAGGLEPRLLIDLGIGFVLTDLLAHSPEVEGAGVCLTASHSLRAAYEWLGIRAQVVPCQLSVKRRDGSGTLYGAKSPSYDLHRGMFSGHCLTYLPDRQRVCDLTVAQFPEVRRVDPSPVLGMAALQSDDGLRTFSDPTPGPLVDGQEFMVMRAGLVLTYSFLGAEATETVHTLVPREPMDSAAAMQAHLVNGLHATAMVVAIAALDPKLTRAARTLTDIPRFGALVDALQGATWDCSERAPHEPDAFIRPDGTRVLMRDLALQPGVPGPLPQTPVKVLA
jgi:hypothetical protein